MFQKKKKSWVQNMGFLKGPIFQHVWVLEVFFSGFGGIWALFQVMAAVCAAHLRTPVAALASSSTAASQNTFT